MKINNREMILINISVTTILFGLLWMLIENKTPEYKNKKIEIERIESQIRLDQRRISMQKKWINELNLLQKNLTTFDYSQKSVSPQLMQTIKNLAIKQGVEITRSQPYPEKPTGDLYEMGINCTWNGELSAIVKFLTELQQKGVQYDIRTLNISPDGKKNNLLKGNMVIHCAYLRNPEIKK